MEKCFCHLTISGESYKLKDMDARESIEALEDEVDSINEDIEALTTSVNNKVDTNTFNENISALTTSVNSKATSEDLEALRTQIENDIIGALEGEY